MRIEYGDGDFPSDAIRARFSRAAGEIQKSEGLSEGDKLEVGVRFVTEEQMRALNLEFRGKDLSTDVLSFPMYESAEEIREAAASSVRMGAPETLIGDVVLCETVAARQAAEFGNTADQELTHLFVHSLLHLFGYDHERDEDYEEMRTKEKVIMEELDVK